MRIHNHSKRTLERVFALPCRRPAALPALLLVAALTAAETAADSVRLSPGKLVTLPATAVRVRVPDGMQLRPSQAPAALTFRYTTRTGESGELAGFHPRELWRHDQCAGRFVGEMGRLRVFDVTYAPLGRIKSIHPDRPHVPRERYLEAREKLSSFGAEEASAWVEYLTGRTVSGVSSKMRGLYARKPYLRFTLESAGPHEPPLYLVQVRRRPLQVLALWIELAPGKQYRNVQPTLFKMVEDIRPASRVAARRNDEADRRMQSRRVDSPEQDSLQHKQTREAVIRNLRNLPDWWFVETPHYVIASDLPRRRRRFVRDIQENLQTLRNAYERLLPPREEIEEVSVVRVFDERRTFKDYLGDTVQKEWALGMWMPQRRELVISPFDASDDDRDRESMLRTVYHEGFHQYVHYAMAGAGIPIWINEGHATFFEGADIGFRGENIEIGEVESRAGLLERILDERDDRPLGLARLMALSTREFYAEQGRLQRYSLAWGLVYFLRKAADQYPEQPYEQVCEAVFDACAERGGTARAGSAAALAMLDMERLEEDFRDFWTSGSRRRRAERRELFE